jgi:hypothetical protein
MTQCIVLGEQELVGKAPIQFTYCLITDSVYKANPEDNHCCEMLPTNDTPTQYDNIELICKCYTAGENRNGPYYDLMFAYHDGENRSAGTIYLGYWNDGIV